MFRVRQLTQDDSHVICRDDQVDRRGQPRPAAGAPPVRAVRLRAALQAGHAAREAARHATSSGTWPRASWPRRSSQPASPTRSIRAAARSTRRRSTSSSRTRWVGSGRWPPSSSTTSCRSASSWSTAAADGGFGAPGRRPLRDLRQLRALHRRHHRALRRRLPARGWRRCRSMVIPIADRHVESGRELAAVLGARGLRAEVDDSDNGCRPSCATPRSRRCRSCSCSAIARSRPARPPPGRRAGEQLPAEAWDELADRLAREAAERVP